MNILLNKRSKSEVFPSKNAREDDYKLLDSIPFQPGNFIIQNILKKYTYRQWKDVLANNRYWPTILHYMDMYFSFGERF